MDNNRLTLGKIAGVAVINDTDVYTSIYHKYQNCLAKFKNGELEVVKGFEQYCLKKRAQAWLGHCSFFLIR